MAEKVKVLIFAGGAGRRMNARSLPKQFLQVYGKPVIIHTLEHFEYHEMIDEIVIVCLKNWIDELKGMLKRFGIRKVTIIVPGGKYNIAIVLDTSGSMNDSFTTSTGTEPRPSAKRSAKPWITALSTWWAMSASGFASGSCSGRS